MRRLPILFAALAALALPAWRTAPAVAADDKAPRVSGDFDALLARAGSPLDADVVTKLCRHAAIRDPDAAQHLIGVLWHGGGVVAARGLRSLAAHADPAVRAVALRGVAHVGLRLAEGMDDLRRAMDDRDPAVKLAAFEAVGRVGDAADMPTLLAALASKDQTLALSGYRALTSLTGEHLTALSMRWASWWASAQQELPSRVAAALDVIAAGGTPVDLDDARHLVFQHGWMSREVVEASVRAWLRASEPRLRAEGYAAAAALRLGDLAADVSSAFRYERDADAWAAGRASAALLGTPMDGIKPPDRPVGAAPTPR